MFYFSEIEGWPKPFYVLFFLFLFFEFKIFSFDDITIVTHRLGLLLTG